VELQSWTEFLCGGSLCSGTLNVMHPIRSRGVVISRVQYPAPKAASAIRIPSRTLVRFPAIDIAIPPQHSLDDLVFHDDVSRGGKGQEPM
jgi:hypothetical protein